MRKNAYSLPNANLDHCVAFPICLPLSFIYSSVSQRAQHRPHGGDKKSLGGDKTVRGDKTTGGGDKLTGGSRAMVSFCTGCS